MLVPCRKFGISMSKSAHLHKSKIHKSLFPSSAFRSHSLYVFCVFFFFCSDKGCPSCALTSAGLNGFRCMSVFVTRFSPGPRPDPFFCLACSRSLLPRLSPSSTSPAGQLSLPDAPLSLQGPADGVCRTPAAGPKARRVYQHPLSKIPGCAGVTTKLSALFLNTLYFSVGSLR